MGKPLGGNFHGCVGDPSTPPLFKRDFPEHGAPAAGSPALQGSSQKEVKEAELVSCQVPPGRGEGGGGTGVTHPGHFQMGKRLGGGAEGLLEAVASQNRLFPYDQSSQAPPARVPRLSALRCCAQQQWGQKVHQPCVRSTGPLSRALSLLC
jgi:hypothetical protein